MDPLVTPVEQPHPVSAPKFELQPDSESPRMSFTAIAGTAVVLIPVLVVVFGLVKDSTKPAPAKVYSAPAPVVPAPLPSWMNTPSKPAPVVNYQPRVSWDGPNDMEYFADPEVDISSVMNLTSEEVKATVFKNRIAKLRVVINTEGEIDNVETISGHPLLVAAATESAKRSIFSSRSKPTTRILTYTFRVLKD